MVRQSRTFTRARFITGGIATGVIVLGLAGCNQYFERQDTITLGLGDAVEHNKLTHTIHPWPPGSKNPWHGTNGARSTLAVQRYEKNQSIEPESLRSQNIEKN